MPRLTEATRAARRSQILDAALRCFAQMGYHAATMEDIAGAAGLSAANLYRHFSSKADLVEAIAVERHRREVALIDLAFEGVDPSEGLHRLCDAYVDWLKDPDERLRRRVGVEIWAHGLRDARTRAVVRRGLRQHRQLIERLERARRDGKLPERFDPEGAARLLLALFHGVILQQAFEPSLDVDRIAAAAHRLIDGLLHAPSPDHPPSARVRGTP